MIDSITFSLNCVLCVSCCTFYDAGRNQGYVLASLKYFKKASKHPSMIDFSESMFPIKSANPANRLYRFSGFAMSSSWDLTPCKSLRVVYI